MGEKGGVIRAICPDFVCRVCRTKTGWPHQSWCSLVRKNANECLDCRYYNKRKACCAHPGKDKPLRKRPVNYNGAGMPSGDGRV
ncbi:MAG: hypothetical protein IJQ45_03280 [Clostridia bacterium]|nr:hypothetical protein [Clostridia bacterium]